MQRGFDSLLKDWAGASGRPSGRKNTIPTCCTHCCGPQRGPFGVLTNVITPRLGLRPQYWWPGLGVVGGFVIGMAGPGFGVLALESFRYFWVKDYNCPLYFYYCRHAHAPTADHHFYLHLHLYTCTHPLRSIFCRHFL